MAEDLDYSEQKIVLMYRTVFLRISVALLAIIFAGCFAKEKAKHLPYYNTPDFTPQFLNTANDFKEKITHTINPFVFTDQNGKQVSDKDIEGKIHVANFIFTSCTSICPVMAKHMKLLQQEFKDNRDIVMLSYSVTPWIDNVDRLKKYAVNNEITSPNWHLLTGSKAEIYTLARQSYFAEEDLGFTKDSTQFLHTEHILLVDKTKRIRGIYNGTLELEAEQLIKDIKELMKE
jgi:protein SCO1